MYHASCVEIYSQQEGVYNIVSMFLFVATLILY